MAQKVQKLGIKREKGWQYYIDMAGNVSRKHIAGSGAKKQNLGKEVVAKTGIKMEKGFLYFIDKDGDISRAVMAKK